MSTLAVTTILHLVVGLVVAAVMLDDSPLSSQVGLTVVAGAFGAIAVAVGRAIHGRGSSRPGCCSAWCPPWWASGWCWASAHAGSATHSIGSPASRSVMPRVS